jgi:Domain of unknown function (DUF4760)
MASDYRQARAIRAFRRCHATTIARWRCRTGTGWKALKLHLTAGQTVKSFEETNEQTYRHILKYLNIHELVAVGIKNRVFDDDVCFNFLGDVLVQHADETAAVVDYEIETEGVPSAAFFQLRELSAEWTERARIWREKQAKRQNAK